MLVIKPYIIQLLMFIFYLKQHRIFRYHIDDCVKCKVEVFCNLYNSLTSLSIETDYRGDSL